MQTPDTCLIDHQYNDGLEKLIEKYLFLVYSVINLIGFSVFQVQ